MEVSRKWQFHFFDDLASQRYYLPISSPPHRKEPTPHLAEKPMWEICFERGAQSIFRLSGEIFRQTEKMGMMCTAYGGQPRQEDSISSKTVTEIALK